MKLTGSFWFSLALGIVIVWAGLLGAPGCNSMPQKDLHACFWTLKSSSLFGKTVGDSARMGTCEPFRREQLIFKLCGITVNKNGKLIRPEVTEEDEPDPGCTNKEIKKYIETGAY